MTAGPNKAREDHKQLATAVEEWEPCPATMMSESPLSHTGLTVYPLNNIDNSDMETTKPTTWMVITTRSRPCRLL